MAPPIELTDQDDRPFSLASLRGQPTMVFFGYTHCPDVCPATIGTMGLAMAAFGPGVRAVFVTVDPERDTPTWLNEYVRYLPTGFVALTGTAGQIRTTADAWGVRYARVEGTDARTPTRCRTRPTSTWSMPTGCSGRRFPFGTEAPAMTAVLREVAATTQVATPSAAVGVTGTAPPSPPDHDRGARGRAARARRHRRVIRRLGGAFDAGHPDARARGNAR